MGAGIWRHSFLAGGGRLAAFVSRRAGVWRHLKLRKNTYFQEFVVVNRQLPPEILRQSVEPMPRNFSFRESGRAKSEISHKLCWDVFLVSRICARKCKRESKDYTSSNPNYQCKFSESSQFYLTKYGKMAGSTFRYVGHI